MFADIAKPLSSDVFSGLSKLSSAKPFDLGYDTSSLTKMFADIAKPLSSDVFSGLSKLSSAKPFDLGYDTSSLTKMFADIAKPLSPDVFSGLSALGPSPKSSHNLGSTFTLEVPVLPIPTGKWLIDVFPLDALRGLHPGLPNLWFGAMLAFTSTNPDRIRHVATSLRELLMHVLRILAPDRIVLSRPTNSADVANGRPTRAARLRFIFEAKGRSAVNSSQEEISDFLHHLDDLSGYTHRLGVKVSDGEFEDLISTTMEHLASLLPDDKKN